MGREAVAKTNYNSGEFSPRVFGRTDVDKYYNGVARMKNFIPLPFGGCQRTPGTVYVNTVKDSSKTARIIDWVFGSNQAYILQLNDGVIRFYKDKSTVLESLDITITAITNANPGVITATAHGLSDGDHITFAGVDGMTELNGNEYLVDDATANTFTLTTIGGSPIDTTSYGIFVAHSATILLLHFNSNFADASDTPHIPVQNGDVTTSTAQKKFGTASAIFDGTGDYISIPDSADFFFDTGDFCIDFWVRFTAVTNCAFWTQYVDADNHISLYRDAGDMVFIAKAATVDQAQYSFTWTPSTNTWYHVSATRNGTSFKIFIDGVSQTLTTGTAISTNSIPNLAVNPQIAGTQLAAAGLNGYIDEFRITKGAARYTANFTPPTAESPVGSGDVTTGELTTAYEIEHEYADDELFEIHTAQAADIMYIAHGDHTPQKLSRFDDDDWTIADVDFQDGPYLEENTTATTLDPSSDTGTVTVVASSTTGINDDMGFLTSDVGRLIRIKYGSTWYWMKIVAWVSTVSVTATIQESATMSAHTATAVWRLGAWSDTTGYPRSVAFFGGALWWGGSETQPQTVWRSVVLDYENMDEGTADDADALTVELNSEKVNIIRWLSPSRRLISGTEGENFTIWSGNQANPVTPTNVRADPETNYGSSNVPPIKIGSYVYYFQDDEITLREFYYDFGIDTYRSVNKSILSEHITNGKVKQVAYQKAPFGILYSVLDDGKLATFTREIEQEVNGWSDQTPRTGDLYKSVAAIPVSDGYTEVWFIVQRTINGATVQYVEYQVNPRQDVEEDIEDMILMHSALTYDGSPATLISGLSHLANTAVQVLADGIEVTGLTVSVGGTLTLPSAASVVQIGLANTGQIKLLPIEAGSQIGSSQGMVKKVSSIFARVYNSIGLKVGEDGGNMEDLFVDGNGSVATTLQTADFECPSTLGWDERQQLLFENLTPYPTTILQTVLYEFTTEENVA